MHRVQEEAALLYPIQMIILLTSYHKLYLHQLIFEVDKEELGAYVDIAGVKKEGLDELPATAKRRHLRAILEGLSLALTEDRKLHGLGYHNLLFMMG